MPDRMSILSPTGHLGFTPIERGSFELGVARRPDAIVADSGSCDIGPQPLGADEHCSPEEWQRHDLELMLLAARRLGIPMIVGSASDTGTDRGVKQYGPGARYQLYYHVYGRDGVMGPWEPTPVPAHELCLVVEAVAPRWEDAEVICALGTRNLFYARLPEVKGTAGTAALMMDEVLRGKPGYEWTVHHVLPLADPLELCTVRLEEVGR